MDGRPGFDSRQSQEIILFSTSCRPVLGPNQPPIQRAPGALSPGTKRPDSEADYSPPSISEIKNCGAINCFSHNGGGGGGATWVPTAKRPRTVHFYLARVNMMMENLVE
jgi:hypothetical protein